MKKGERKLQQEQTAASRRIRGSTLKRSEEGIKERRERGRRSSKGRCSRLNTEKYEDRKRS